MILKTKPLFMPLPASLGKFGSNILQITAETEKTHHIYAAFTAEAGSLIAYIFARLACSQKNFIAIRFIVLKV